MVVPRGTRPANSGIRSAHLVPMMALVATGLTVTGCGPSGSDSCPRDPTARPAKVLTPPEVPESPENTSNLFLDLTSGLAQPVCVSVEFSSKLALDIELARSSPQCSGQLVYHYAYRLPDTRIRVKVTTDSGQVDTRTVRVGRHKHWLAIEVHEDYPLQLEDYHGPPQWS